MMLPWSSRSFKKTSAHQPAIPKIEIEPLETQKTNRCELSLNFALQRQHGDIICLGGFADMGKKMGSDPLHEFEYGFHRLR